MQAALGNGLSIVALLLSLQAGIAAQAPSASNTCLSCHATRSDARLSTPAAQFSQPDVHRERGFQCVDCHGGDPRAGDEARAHAADAGFTRALSGTAQIATCARCHSDAELMRRFSPRQRVDQAAEYATSVHGKRLATGDTKVATCASCHGAHGIRLVRDAASPVYPTNVAATCARCHADPEHMRGYTMEGRSTPLPTNQSAAYQTSVHYAALVKGHDLSAPTCNDCHGNHGAAPPGVGAITNVCGTCHAVFAQKFETSVHKQIFDKGCVECHGNHAIRKPTDEMLGTGAHAVCAECHSGADDKGAAAAATMRAGLDRLEGEIGRSSALVARVKNAGMEMSGQELALGMARTRLTLARTEVHAFDPARLAPILEEGMKMALDVEQAGNRAVEDLRFRRFGLALSLGAMLLVVVALGLKIRQIERRTE
jgi:hypothetical protein